MMDRNKIELIEAMQLSERYLLGALLYLSAERDSPALHNIKGMGLKPSDFSSYLPGRSMVQQPRHSRIFAGMLAANKFDEVGTAFAMSQANILQKGDIAYFFDCLHDCPQAYDYLHYARCVLQYSVQRKIDYFNRINQPEKVKREIKRLYLEQQRGVIV